MLIANSDQFIEWNASKSMYKFISKKADGGILTFEAIHPKWSYAKVDQNNKVLEVAEKNDSVLIVTLFQHFHDIHVTLLFCDNKGCSF